MMKSHQEKAKKFPASPKEEKREINLAEVP
jgi:hypothetical protein